MLRELLLGGRARLPRIKAADFELRTTEIVGTRIRVTNTDGSKHLEEIVECHSDRMLTLHFQDLSPPVSSLATSFEETWVFEPSELGTKVIHCFKLYARSAFTRQLLWLISIFLKKAIERHLTQMRANASSRAPPHGA